MALGRFGTMAAAAALACAAPVRADYAAGKAAWDAGRPAAALAEWRAAADGGGRRSMLALGRLYVQGLGAPQDFVLAHMWFNLAASWGEAAALEERDALAAKMTPAALAEAQKRARDWRPGPGAVFRDCPECPEMVVVPAGSFTMGSPSSEEGWHKSEGPVHRVTIPALFAVGKYEVTFAEWDACVSAGGCGGHRPDDKGWGRGARPVIDVSWNDAKAYVGWLSGKTGKKYRLLSESEWEYAARAGTTTRYYWGDGSSGQCDYANGADRALKRQQSGRIGIVADCDDGHYRTAPVGSFKANVFGLHDMHGNVWEWVEDCWNASYAGAPSDGRVWESGDCGVRGSRGGGWSSSPGSLRAAFRGWLDSGDRYVSNGFRVARTLTP